MEFNLAYAIRDRRGGGERLVARLVKYIKRCRFESGQRPFGKSSVKVKHNSRPHCSFGSIPDSFIFLLRPFWKSHTRNG